MSVRACVHSHFQTLISLRPTGQSQFKFRLKYHLSEGRAALCFGPDRIITLFSMATESSHNVIMGSTVLIGPFSYSQVTMTYTRAWMSSKFGQIRPRTKELATIESHVGSFSYFHIAKTYIKAWLILNVYQILPLTTELSALERLTNRCLHVFSG